MIESPNTKTIRGSMRLKWVDAAPWHKYSRSNIRKPSPCVWARWKWNRPTPFWQLLPTHLHADVSLRLATMREVQPDVLAELSEKPAKFLSASMGMSSMSVGGAELMADILTRVDKNTEGAIMAKITEKGSGLGR